MIVKRLGNEYKGFQIRASYQTSYYYEVKQMESKDCFGVSFHRTPFPNPVTRGFEDTLLSDWLEDPFAMGVFEDDILLGFVELSKESWTNRMRIANIFVEAHARGKGIASILMKEAKEQAKKAGVRALILETQTCNDPAIQIYLHHGFRFLGCDLSAYTSKDIQRKEVRIELSYDIK